MGENHAVARGTASIDRIVLGCGNFGGIGSAPELFGHGESDDEAFAIMDAAWAAGIRRFDTADAYGGGRSEAAIGKWIHATGNRPTITTKTFNPMDAGADRGLSRERIRRQVHTSLERLGLDHLDRYLAHEFDPDVTLEETLGEFEELRAAGLIGGYGVSNFSAEQVLAAAALAEIAVVQNEHSLLERRDEAEVLPVCAERGIDYEGFSPLAGGWLTGKYRTASEWPAGSRMTLRPRPYEHLVEPRVFSAVQALEEKAAARGVDAATLALAWLLADERVTRIVVGPRRPEHLEPALRATALTLSPGEREGIASIFG
jgi:aryl-alcohol dehydrogenase-like predicted oxidoreductase